jgi:hypothetical protein
LIGNGNSSLEDSGPGTSIVPWVPNGIAMPGDSTGGSGLQIVSPCTDSSFADPVTGYCGSVATYQSSSCAFGSGDKCIACPEGAVCPVSFPTSPFYTLL